jgi:glucose/arabinose dehydrogenase
MRTANLSDFSRLRLELQIRRLASDQTIAFAPSGKLYVSVGSSCNACAEKEKERATVLEMNADGSTGAFSRAACAMRRIKVDRKFPFRH